MRFIMYCPISFEPWNWTNSIEKGIGGSETSTVEQSWRLAARGHEVIVYAPVPKDSPTEWRGTKWYPIEKADFKQEGVWILYRCPAIVDKFPPMGKRVNQKLWVLMQDWDYNEWNGIKGNRRIRNTDLIITLCKSHGKDVVEKHPLIKKCNNLWLTSNGVKVDLIEKIEKENIKRNPLKIVHTSSPDRALRYCLKSFIKAREYIPELEFHAYYGFNNLDKLIKNNPKHWLYKLKEETEELMKTPGFVFHGRITQEDLYREFFSAGIWMYSTNFNETSCISSMEAQSMGAVPVFSPKYALSENVKYGIVVTGDANDSLVQASFGAELVRLASNPKMQEDIRKEMMPYARNRFSWENFVDQWIAKAEGKPYDKEFPEQLVYET